MIGTVLTTLTRTALTGVLIEFRLVSKPRLLLLGQGPGQTLFEALPPSLPKAHNVHAPLCMAVAFVPVIGAVANMEPRPLRRRLFIRIRLMLDHVAIKLPFRF